MNRLIELLEQLSVDPYRLDAYVSNPDAVLDAAGLDIPDRDVLRRLAGHTPEPDRIEVAETIVLFDPGPDPFFDPDPYDPDSVAPAGRGPADGLADREDDTADTDIEAS